MEIGHRSVEGLSRPSDPHITLPVWFVGWMIDQLGGSLAMHDYEVLEISEQYRNKKQIHWYRKESVAPGGALMIEVTDV